MPGERDPVGRALDVLAWLAENPGEPWGVRGMARELEMSPTTLHRILNLLARRNFVQKHGTGEYSPGAELLHLGHTIANRVSPIPLLHPHTRALSEMFDETADMGLYSRQRKAVFFIDAVHSTQPVRYTVDRGRWHPLHAGATGLAILAFLPERERQAIYDQGLISITQRTLIDQVAIERELETIRKDGYACTAGQREQGVVGLAAPIFDAGGDVFGDMCLTIPDQRFLTRNKDRIGTAVAEAASRASDALRGLHYYHGSGEVTR